LEKTGARGEKEDRGEGKVPRRIYIMQLVPKRQNWEKEWTAKKKL